MHRNIGYDQRPDRPFRIDLYRPARIAQAEPRLSLDQLRRRLRNDGLPFADVLTEPRIREVLDEHGVAYRDRVFTPITTLWEFLSQVLSDDHSCGDAVSRSSPTGWPAACPPARPTRPAIATPGAASPPAS